MTFVIFIGFIIGYAQKLFSQIKQNPISWRGEHTVLFLPMPADVTPFLEQVFHPDRGDSHIKIVVLTPKKENLPKSMVRRMMNDSFYKYRVKFMYGDLFESEDKHLVRLSTASSVALYAPYSSMSNPSLFSWDAATILRATALQHCYRDIQIFAQTHTRQGRESLLFQGVTHVLDVQEVSMQLLGLEFRVKGALPFLGNLVRSVDTPSALEEVANKYTLPQNQWLMEYELGLGIEIYQVVLHPGLVGMEYKQISQDLYDSGFLLFGLRRGATAEFSPKGTILHGDIGIFLAPDMKTVVEGLWKVVDSLKSDAEIRMPPLPLRRTQASANRKLGKSLRNRDIKNVSGSISPPTDDVHDHVVICGDLGPSVQYLVDLLPNEQIVLLSTIPEDKVDISWIYEKNYLRCRYLYGDCTTRVHMKRARVHTAKKIIILPTDYTHEPEQTKDMNDVKAITAFKIANSLNTKKRAIIVLWSENSADALLSEYKHPDVTAELLDGGALFNPCYASGQVLLLPTLDMFLVSEILQPELMPLVLGMMHKSVLCTFPLNSPEITRHFHRAPLYKDLFSYMVEVRGYYPVALYRKQETSYVSSEDLEVEYIFTMPPADTQTRDSDIILCVSPTTLTL
eukprot:TRINITY_DN2530_c0_g1_i5.p1 TRINITY_DN2530_c0_g1~~TRINITY_DN2530_c0_g1_i5.p1  ORF type:complete len:624 (+),score=74.58 TRINITY_DN2530_c0_g1_i5:285-2156(+)